MTKFCSACNIRYNDDYTYCDECGSALTELHKKGSSNINMGDTNAISGGINLTSSNHFDSHNTYNQTINSADGATDFSLDEALNDKINDHLKNIGLDGGDFNLNLGDANAINGGIHKVNNTNIDSHDIINKNIAIVQERQKSFEEIKAEKEKQLREVIRNAYEDGIITEEEEHYIKSRIHDLGIEPHIAHKIIMEEKSLAFRRIKDRNLKDEEYALLKVVQQLIRENKKDELKELVDDLMRLNAKIDNGEVQYFYYMLLAAFTPDEFIKAVESKSLGADNFWRTVWLSMAYRLIGECRPLELEIKYVQFISSINEQFPGNIQLAESLDKTKEALQTKVTYKKELFLTEAKKKFEAYNSDHQGWLEELGAAVGCVLKKNNSSESCRFYLESFFPEVAEGLFKPAEPTPAELLFAPIAAIPGIPKIPMIND